MEYSKRKRIRLQGYDYAQNGSYYVTICTHKHEHFFGKIVENGLDRSVNINQNELMQLNNNGKTAENDLKNLPQHFSHIKIDKYVIMPNHIHAIIIIDKCDETKLEAERSRPFPTLSTIIGLYKSGVSRKIGFSLWQKSFYEHIIRNEESYEKIWNYIDTNPQRWLNDKYNI